MSVVDKAFSVYDLAKKGLTIELQEQAMQLRKEALELEEESIRLKKENRELKERIDLQETVHFRRRVYWRDGDPVPFCQYCREKSQQLIHLVGGQDISQVDHKYHYQCPECATRYEVSGEGEFCMDLWHRDHLRGRGK